MPVGATYSLTVDQTLHIVTLANVFHYRQTTAGDGNDEKNLFDAFNVSVFPSWVAVCTGQWEAICMRAKEVSATGTRPEVLELLQNIVGTEIGEALPANSVSCVSVYSETYSKAGRGRSYLSGHPVVDENENTWTNPFMVKLQTLAAALIGTITDGGSGAQFERVVWGGDPATAKKTIRHEVQPEVRKIRRRTRTLCSDT